MTRDERDHLLRIADDRFRASIRLREYVNGVEIEEEPKSKGNRTGQQNRALHKFFGLLADALNESGKDMRVVLKADYFVPWTKESVKEHIWRPIQKAITDKESTTELAKGQEITNIHKVIMREMGERHGIEFIPFPSDDARQLEELAGPALAQANPDRGYEYPDGDSDGRTAFDD